MRMPLDDEACEVIQRLLCPGCLDAFELHQPSQHLCDFDHEQVRRLQSFTR
jgi:hypothetical protein